MPKRKTTWIVIVDGGRGHIVRRREDAQGFEIVAHFKSPEAHLPSRALGSDRPGRVRESSSANAAHHAVEPREDPHQALKAAFIDKVAEHLNRAEGSGAFDQLVLIAPPRRLGELRDHLGARTAAKVAASFGKDLTKLPLAELEQHLASMSQTLT